MISRKTQLNDPMRTNILRIFLALILIGDAVFIFCNSAQNSSDSSSFSQSVTEDIAEIVVSDYKQMTETERSQTVDRLNGIVREAAHMIQFIPLGFSLYLLLCTYFSTKKARIILIPVTLISGAVYALSDELHQIAVPGRAFEWFDIGMDTCGVTLGCLCAVALLVLLTLIKARIRGDHTTV